jgi:hypothetical protein
VLSSRLANAQKDLEKIPVYRGGRGGGGLVGMEIAQPITERAELVQRVEGMKQEIAAAITESRDLLISSAVIRSVINLQNSK